MSKILFLGPEGTYSHKVAVELNKILKNYTLSFKKTFQDIHIDILTNINNIAVLPIENSITSNIYENIEFIFDNKVYIIGEYYLPIILNLIGKKNINISFENKNIIKNIYSHQKALKQSSHFIEKYNFNSIISNSTTEAQKLILEFDGNNFAIGDYPIYSNLEIKKSDIGNFKNNKTRFVFLSKSKIILNNSKSKKVSFICKLKHQKGSLSNFLQIISSININMTKIESKPIVNSNFEYLFFIEGNSNTKIDFHNIKKILDENTLENRIIGIY